MADLPAYGVGVCFGAGPMAVAVSRDARFHGFAGVAGVYTNGFAVASYAHLLAFDAQGAADNLTKPVAIVHSETALAPDLAHRFFARLRGPKDQLWLTSQGQIDFYDDPALVPAAADRVVATFAHAG
ncbi:hypothetical protein AB0H36_30765 [Kribbella sp. NPDC050820]|uniref:hypothetical protein n=1 Tax=Kribbella sp. NPDC050820 TaxID=3155408 RepID=UPI0034025C29